ncbi:hypothetical protein [Burkholderia guangdongensis]|uniref:hypothetical protein n=1 Tax=Burkholderia guangdongensis TaxID=1792500 RepID=UPI0015C772DF|nr:hypothetical protein [Burkholderia guangdongensis]
MAVRTDTVRVEVKRSLKRCMFVAARQCSKSAALPHSNVDVRATFNAHPHAAHHLARPCGHAARVRVPDCALRIDADADTVISPRFACCRRAS